MHTRTTVDWFCGFVILLATMTTVVRAQIGPPPAPLTDLSSRRFGEDWPVFLGPHGDGKSTETGIITNWRDGGLRVVWQFPLEESYGTCTVSRGRVYQFDRQVGKGTLLCLHSETGRQLWKYSYQYDYTDTYGYNSGPRTSPLVDGDRVFLFDVSGNLICVGAADGKEIWKVDTSKQFGVVQNFFGVGSNPVLVGNLLIVMVGGSPPESQNVAPGQLDRVIGNGSGIVAFNKFNGKVVYQLTDELASYASLKVVDHGGSNDCWAASLWSRWACSSFQPTRHPRVPETIKLPRGPRFHRPGQTAATPPRQSTTKRRCNSFCISVQPWLSRRA